MSKPGAALAHADGDARTRVRWSSRHPFRRIAAILTSLALGAGLAVVGIAAPASAHTGDLKANAVCNTETGKYDVTYTLKLSNAGGKTGATKWRVGTTSFQGTPSNANGMDRGPVSSKGNETIVLGTVELDGTAKTGPWVYAYTTWNDSFGKGSDGRVENLKGDCGDSPSVKKLTICHATESDVKNPYVRITIATSAVVNGHLEHQWGEDIIPAFTYKGKPYAAQGDQSLLQYEDCVKPIVEIPVEGVPTFSDTCGPDNEKLNVPADTARIDWNSTESNGVITVTATAMPGYTFKKGAKTTWTFTIDDKPCVVPVVGVPSFSDTCGPDNEKLTVPADTDTIHWDSTEANGVWTVTATAKAGYTFPAGTKTSWEFPIDDSACVIPVVGAPSFSDTCGPDNEQLTVPASTDTITWESTEANGTITVTATAKPGYTFPADAKTSWEFPIDDEPCVIEVVGAPTFSDTCGPDNEQLTVPASTDTITWESTEANGTITVTATAKPGSKFPAGVQTSWVFAVDDNPCVIELVGEPTFDDACGPDNDEVTPPADTETIHWNSVRGDAAWTVTATAQPGYTFKEGGQVTWTFPYSDVDCIEPSLMANVAAGVCEAGSPWILFDVELIDPDEQSTGNVASLVMTDGTNTETIELGELVNGSLSDKVLWPGASVDADGNANGWPGWALVGNKWIEVDDNFAWTRGAIDAKIVVNPETAVTIAYPNATPECAGPKSTPGGQGGSPAASDGTGLASTGFAGTTIAIVAGIIVIAGLAFLVVARIRRKRA